MISRYQSVCKKKEDTSLVTNIKETIPSKHNFITRHRKIDQMEASVRELYEHFHDQKTNSEPWVTENVSKCVEHLVQDFQSLLKWLEKEESKKNYWNTQTIGHINQGLLKVHKNLLKQLQEIEDNYKYTMHYSSLVKFIGDHLNKPDHYLVKTAQQHIESMETLYQKAIQELSRSDTSMVARLEMENCQGSAWNEYHDVSRQLKDICARLWVVEMTEERVAELDDWRDEADYWTSDELQEVCSRIDVQRRKIAAYSQKDVTNQWTTVEGDLWSLQELRVQSLLTWLTQQPPSSRPPWLTRELTEWLTDKCNFYDKNYPSLRTGVEGEKIALDINYGQIRSVMARVKYSSLENTRHERELHVYRTWLNQNGEMLQASSRDQIVKVMRKADEKVLEVKKALELYNNSLGNKEENQEIINTANILDSLRSRKRAAMREVANNVFYSRREGKSRREEKRRVVMPFIDLEVSRADLDS